MPHNDHPSDIREDGRARVEADGDIPPHALAALVGILNRVFGETKAGDAP